jgi:hypothetical protein
MKTEHRAGSLVELKFDVVCGIFIHNSHFNKTAATTLCLVYFLRNIRQVLSTPQREAAAATQTCQFISWKVGDNIPF